MRTVRVALVCPANFAFMPYVSSYLEQLIQYGANVETIIWDRLGIADEHPTHSFRDKKIGHQRNYLDYVRYSRFAENIITKGAYDRLVIFGIQLAFFLRRLLQRNFYTRYVLDIRDHNKLLYFFNPESIIKGSVFTAISSPAYQLWLPQGPTYVVNHNASAAETFHQTRSGGRDKGGARLGISCIGALRDFDINADLVRALAHSTCFAVRFHGDGTVSDRLSQLVRDGHIENAEVTGRYRKEDEPGLYARSAMINVLRYPDGINNKTALPNRLYNAPALCVPLLAYSGTYLAELVSTFSLGLVIDSFDHLEGALLDYLTAFDSGKYDEGRENFLEQVRADNALFGDRLEKFATHS